jgi:hypothetical protein
VSRSLYNHGDEILEVTIRDTSGARIEIRRSNISDKKENGNILSWLIKKWNVKFQLDKSFLDIDSDFFKY